MARITTWTEQSVLSGDEVLAVDDGTSGKKVKVSTIWDNIPNVDTTVDGIEVTGKITVGSQTLGNSAGDQVIQAEFKNYNANDSYIRIIDERQEDGTDWTTASKRIQFGVDVSDHAFISADHDASGLRGLTLGTHNNAQVEEKFIVCDADGDVALYYDNAKKLETTSYGVDVTGALKADNYIALDGYSTPDGDSNPDFYITNYETAVDGQNLGIVSFRGQNSTGEVTNYASLIGYAPATGDGLESGAVHFSIRQPGDSYIQPLVVDVDGISVTGTVAASDGLTADYIDLTGGEATTATGNIACKEIVLNDPTSTNGGDDGTDQARIFTEEGSDNQTKLVLHAADDGNDQIVLRNGYGTSNTTDILVADINGIDVTGTVKGDSLTIDNGSGLTDAYIASATGKALLTVKSTHDGEVSEEVAGIEVGAKSLSYLDLKIPDDDDYDLRIAHSEANGSLINSLVDDLVLRSGAKVALQHGGSNTKLETTSTGIEVTGTVEADKIQFTAGSGDFASIATNINSTSTSLEFRLGDDDGDAYRWMFNHFQNSGYKEYMRLDVDQTDSNREQGTLRVEGTVAAHRFSADWEKADADSWSSFARDGTANVLYVQQGQDGVDIASFRKGATQPAQGTEVLGVKSDGIEVTGDIEATQSANGVVLKSPDGSRFRITVGNDGTLSTTEI